MSLISNYEYIRDWANAKFLKKSDQIEVDLSNYYTKGQLYNKTELESRFSEINSNLSVISSNYAKQTDFDVLNSKVNALPRIFSGTCSTSAGTAAKVVSCSGYSLTKGDVIFVTFSYTNNQSSPTLNVNSTGAKSIRAIVNGTLTTLPNPGAIYANETLQFQYDGTYWVLMNLDTAPGTLSTTSTSSLSTSSSESLRGNISLHKIAKTGSYDDLNNKPTIPTTTSSVTSGSSAALTSGGAYSALSEKEDTSNKVTSISSSSTDTQYPSARAVYTQIGNVEAALDEIIQPTPILSVTDTLSIESFYSASEDPALTGIKPLRIYGDYLTGNVSLSVSGTNASMFTLSTTSVTKAQALAGYDVTVTYTPTAIGTHTATITVTSSGATSKTVAVTGTASEYMV